jgi:hypothetical protein
MDRRVVVAEAAEAAEAEAITASRRSTFLIGRTVVAEAAEAAGDCKDRHRWAA